MIQVSHPTTAAEVLANAAAVRKRLFSPRIAARKAAEAETLITAPVAEEPQPDAMVITLDMENLSPRQFIRLKCREYGFDHAALCQGGKKNRRHAEDRDKIIRDVRERFPKLSLGRIGAEFGGMDHSSVFTSLQRSGVPVQRRVRAEVPRDRVVAMLNAGHPQYKVAEAIGCSESMVSLIAKSIGKSKPTRLIESKKAEIKELFDAGWSHSNIALELDFCASGISRFIQRMRWTR